MTRPSGLANRSRRWLTLVTATLVGTVATAQEPAELQQKSTGKELLVVSPALAKSSEGLTPLFDGISLAGWHGIANTIDIRKIDAMSPAERVKTIAEWTEDAKQHWKWDNGVLINDGEGKFLATDKNYGDVHLTLDYKTVANADSGIYLRGSPQVQIWDYTEQGGKHKLGSDKGSGGLWNNSPGAPGKDPLVRADKPFGEWNHVEVIQVGARTTVKLNDQLVVDHALMENYFDRKLPLFAKGPIILQTHGGEIQWRNIFRPARSPPTRQTRSSRRKHAEGFKPRSSTARISPAGPDRWRQLRGRRRRPEMQDRRGRERSITYQGTRRLRRAGRVQAPPRRQQRPGDPLPR